MLNVTSSIVEPLIRERDNSVQQQLWDNSGTQDFYYLQEEENFSTKDKMAALYSEVPLREGWACVIIRHTFLACSPLKQYKTEVG